MVDNIHAFINGAELPYPNQTDPAIDFESTKLSESGRIAVMDLIAR